MQKSKTATRRALVTSILSLLVCVSMLLGTTFAWFTDSVTSGVNKIVAGNLDIELTHTNASATNQTVQNATNLFPDKDGNAMLWEPGAMSYENFTVSNVGTLALKYKLAMNITDWNTLEQHSLKEVLKVKVLKETDILTSVTREAVAALDWSTTDTLDVFQDEDNLTAGNSKNFQVIVYWQPTDNDNTWNANNGKETSDGQPLYVDFGINLVATQLENESDSFDNTYDANATYPILASIVNKSETYSGNFAQNKFATGTGESTQVTAKEDITLNGETTTLIPQGTTLFTNNGGVDTPITTTDSSEGGFDGSIVSNIKTTDTTADSVTYNISYTYKEGNTETSVSKFSQIVTNTFNLSDGLKNVKVTTTHNGGTESALTSVDSEPATPVDGTFFYDSSTGELNIYSSTYSDFKITYSTDFVAAVNGQGYVTLKGAFAEAKDGQTVVLLKDTELTYNITIEKNIIFEMGTHTISVNGIEGNVFALAAGKTATVQNGTFADKTNGACTNVFAVAENTTETASTLTLDTVDFGTFNTNNGSLVRLFSGNTNAVVNNITGTTNWRCLNSSEDAASLKATNCTLTCNSAKAAVYSPKVSAINYCTVNNNSGYVLGCPTENTMTVNGGTYTGSVVLKVYTSGGHIIANGVTVNGTSYAIYGDSRNAGENYDHSGDVTVTGNSKITGCIGTQHAAKVYLTSGEYAISGWSASIADSIVVSGGTYTVNPTTLNGFVLASGYKVTENATDPKTWTVEKDYQVKISKTGETDVSMTMEEFRDSVNNGNTYEGYTVTLLKDVTLSGEWVPIGLKDAGTPFKGTFDGDNYTVSGLSITKNPDNEDYAALFGLVAGGTVRNLTVSGSVTADNAAGVVARFDGGTISNVVSNVTVTGVKKAGGITVLAQEGATFEKCTNKGSVTLNASGANRSLGGIVSMVNSPVTVKDCVNEAAISCSGGNAQLVAGIVGYYQTDTGNQTLRIDGCTNKGSITVTSSGANTVGGIVGKVGKGAHAWTGYLALKNCKNEGTLTGADIIGSIADVAAYGSYSGSYKPGTVKVYGTLTVRTGEKICGNYNLAYNRSETLVANPVSENYVNPTPVTQDGYDIYTGVDTE